MTTDLSYTLAGWREWVSLPGVGVPWIKAKLDTGARSSAIHAFDLEEFEKDGDTWVRYSVHPWQKSDADAVDVESRVEDMRAVRSSSGHAEERYVVQAGDSLWALAVARFGGDPREGVWHIRERNGLDGAGLTPGMVLYLPAQAGGA